MELKPGYKLTDVGVIPEDWNAAALGEKTVKIGSGITPTGGARVYRQEGRPFVRSQNVGWGCLLMDDVAFIDEVTHESFNATEIEAGDVFLNITGASIGRSALADDRVRGGNVNQHVCIIRPKPDELDARFLNYFLLSTPAQRQIDSFQAGGNRQGLNFGQIRSFMLPVPPLAEQRAIAGALSDVDALIGALDQLLAKKRDLKQAAMQQLLTGHQRLPGFATRWEVKPLGEICSLINGRGFKPHEWVESGLPIIRIQNLNGSEEFNYYAGTYDPKILVEHGQLLFAWSGSRGTSFGPHIWNGGRALLNYHTWKLVVDECRVRPDFFFHALRQLTISIEDQAHGASALVHTQKGEMEQLPVSIPPLAEQTAIAEVLSDMDAELAALEQKRDKTRLLKQGMMQELLTGRTRLI